MKLRNKKTPNKFGEIVPYDVGKGSGIAIKTDQGIVWYYHSLAELNEEWEDVSEEPKEYWFISDRYKVFHTEDTSFIDKERKSLGNYFETREEAEKAVENLKALKILKDSGFRFIQWEFDMKTIADGKIWFDVGVNTQWDAEQLLKHRPEVKESLDLLFGGEE